MSKDIEFLSSLQKELKNQDTDYQDSPRLWVIMDYRDIPTHYDFADNYSYYHDDGNDGEFVEFNNSKELEEFIKKYYDADDFIKNKPKEIEHNYSFEKLWRWVLDNFNEYGFFDTLPTKRESFIREGTLFLTKEEALSHLKNNKYNYSKDAHIYPMTAAWRSPKVSRLWEILENFNWEELLDSLQPIPADEWT